MTGTGWALVRGRWVWGTIDREAMTFVPLPYGSRKAVPLAGVKGWTASPGPPPRERPRKVALGYDRKTLRSVYLLDGKP